MSNAKIMIVEDNTTVAEDCRCSLEELGYCVTSIAASGERALIDVETDQPDAIIMDIRLRGKMDGIETAEQIHTRFDIPVVFLSAYSDSGLLNRAKRVGSFGYLVKPFEERELFAMLETALFKAQTEKEHKLLEARLRQSQKMAGLQVLAGSIAHSFNNMLHVARGYTNLAIDQLPTDSETSELLREASKAISRAAEMSTLMLLYVGQGTTDRKPANLSKLVQSTGKLLPGAAQGQFSIELELANEDAAITVATAQIQQLIANIFTNAAEAIGDKPGKITITTSVAEFSSDELRDTYLHQDLPAGDYAVLEISDTGCGMTAEIIDKVFDPFFTTHFTGRGMGLAAVLGIIKGHEGAIDIKSQPGEGTTFTVMFPVTGKIEPLVEDEPKKEEQQPQADITILLIDDEDAVRIVGKMMLLRQGFKVITAAGGHEAVMAFREHSDEIDCVVLDLTMPHKGGRETFFELRQIQPDVKVILSSGHSEDIAMARFGDGALAGFLQKPYGAAALKETITEVLGLG